VSRPEPSTDALAGDRSGTDAGGTDRPAEMQYIESGEKRRQRLSTGVLIGVVGVLLLVLLPSTTGMARFALSDAFDEVQLPTVSLPGVVTVLACALLLLAAAVGFLSGRMAGHWPAIAGAIAGLALVVGFLTWAAAGATIPEGPLREAVRRRIVAVYAKVGAPPDGRLRGRRQVQVSENPFYEAELKVAVAGMLAAQLRDTVLYISGTAMHQGPPGGGSVAVIYDNSPEL
jgi:simple sugar transport system permease protein